LPSECSKCKRERIIVYTREAGVSGHCRDHGGDMSSLGFGPRHTHGAA